MVVVKKTLTAAPAETPVLRSSSNYMETLQQVKPVSGGASLQAFLNDSGKLDIYSIGTDNRVFRIRQDANSHAPYSAADLGVSLQQLSLYSEFNTPENNPNILGINSAGKLSLARFKNNAYSQEAFQPANATETLVRFLSTRSATGKIYANVMFEAPNQRGSFLLGNNFFDPATLKWAADHWATVQGPDGKDAIVKDIAICSNSLLQQSLFAIGTNDRVWFSQGNFSSGASKMVDLGKLFVRSIAVAVDASADALLHIFATERDTGFVWVKRQKKYLVDGKVQWEDWVKIPSISNVPLNRVFATLNYQNMLEVFAIAEDGRLYQSSQSLTAPNKTTWSALFPLGNEVGNSIFTVVQANNGYSEVYTVTHDNQLKRFWQSPETTQWFNEPLAVDDPAQEIATVPTHSLDLTILDTNGVVQPNSEVTLATSFLTNLQVNGLSFLSSPTEKVKVKTDNAGKLSILQRADRLAAASLLIETPFTSLGQPVQVEPNAQLQEKMYQVTGDQVYNAKDKSGNYLLPEDKRTPENAASIAAIMKQSMQLGLADKNSGKVLYHFASKGKSAGWDARMNLAGVQEQHWEIDFQSGFPTYQQLNSTMVSRYLSEMPAAQPEGFWDGIKDAWGKFWNAVKEGVSFIIDGLKKIIVTTIIDPITGLVSKVKVFFEMLIDGIRQVIETVIEFVQQAFDFIEGIWNWLKVKLEQLYEWLAFFFNWDDISRTAEAFIYSTNLVLDFTVASFTYARGGVDQWFTDIKTELKGAVDKYVGTLNNEDKVGNVGKKYEKPIPEEENAMDHNIMLNAFKQNYEGTKAKVNAAFEEKLADGPIAGLLDKLAELANNFQFGDGKQAFQEALDYFGNIKENPDRALQLLMSGLIKVGESVALFGLDFGRGVALSIFDIVIDLVNAFKELMNEEWEIPIVSSIYKFITGKTLSFKPITLFAYIIAIPTTVIYKLKEKVAPFPDDQSLTAFEQTYTLDYLKNKAGINKPTLGRRKKDIAAQPVPTAAQESTIRVLFKVGYSITTFVQIFSDIGTAIYCSTAVVGPVNPGKKILGYISLGCTILGGVFTNPWLTEINPSKLCSGGSKGGGGGFAWVASVLSFLRGVAVFIATKAKGWEEPIVTKVDEISKSIVGAVNLVIYIIDYVLQSDKKPVIFARSVAFVVPGSMLRFMDIPELNVDAFFIPVGILSVLTGVGYFSALVLNFYAEDTEAWT